MRTLTYKFLPVGLFLLSLLVLGPGLLGEFVMDDWPVIKENSKITDVKYIPDYFTSGVWANTDLADQAGIGGHSLYRPVFLLTLNLAHQLWGDNAFAYHALNLTLHGINTILVYFLILGFFASASRIPAGLAAAIFAVHPVHVESVAWVAGITDPLVSLFLLSGFLLHRQARQNPGLLPMIGAPLCYALALLCKETAILFPLLLLTFDALFHRASLKTGKLISQYAVYAILLVVYFILRANALDIEPGETGLWARMDFHNWPVLLEFAAHYVQLLFFPYPLEYYYAAPSTSGLALFVGGILIACALFYLPHAFQKGYKTYVLAVAWVSFFLLPTLPVALFDNPIFATRVLYLPSAGLALFVAWLIQHLQNRTVALAKPVWAITSVILLAFTISTLVEIGDWKNDTVFYTRAIKTSPDSYKPVMGLATVKERENNTDDAISLYLKAAKLTLSESDQLDFQESAARIYGQTGSTRKSEQLYRDILRRDATRSSAWVGLGNNALTRNDTQQALQHYQKAYQADASNFVAAYNLTMIYQSLGNLQLAARFRDISQRLQQGSQAK